MISINSNIKIGKGIGIFNLPWKKTCPGATKECKKICYARKREWFKNIKNYRERNYEASKRDDFEMKLRYEMLKLREKRRMGNYFRIHESGDFYNQKYLNAWIRIANANSDVTFLAFTRSFKLDFSKRPSNFIVYYSVDKSSINSLRGRRLIGRIIDNKNEVPQGYRYCWPVGKNENGRIDSSHYHRCGVSCKNCWEGKSNVAFLKH